MSGINADRLREFEALLLDLVRGTIDCFALRFWLVNPDADLSQLTFDDMDCHPEEAYRTKYENLDPLHPKYFEDTDINVVCNHTIMSHVEWKQTSFYTEFMAPRRYEYDVDLFFRRNRKIIAVLALLRDDGLGPFTQQELALLSRLHPILEFSLDSIYPSQWQLDRTRLAQRYCLTDRELDVAEIVMAGVNTKVMAKELDLSVATVKTHLQHIFEKIGVRSTKGLIATLFDEMREYSSGQPLR